MKLLRIRSRRESDTEKDGRESMGSLSSKELVYFQACQSKCQETPPSFCLALLLSLPSSNCPLKLFNSQTFQIELRIGIFLSPVGKFEEKPHVDGPTVWLRSEALTQLSSVHILLPPLPPALFPSWYSHMSNGITTASGEVVVRGEEEGRGCLGVCVVLECKREKKKKRNGDVEKRPPGKRRERDSRRHADLH